VRFEPQSAAHRWEPVSRQDRAAAWPARSWRSAPCAWRAAAARRRLSAAPWRSSR